jgi:hypothetical protein
MASLIQSIGLLEHPLVPGGLPPSVQQQGEPVGLSGALLLVGFLALAFGRRFGSLGGSMSS